MSCPRAPDAVGAATLPEGDPERLELAAHARGCDECAAGLRQGELLARLLEEHPLPAPDAAVLARAAGPVRAELRAAEMSASNAQAARMAPAASRAAQQARPGAPRPAAAGGAWLDGAGLRAAAAVLAFAVPVLFAGGRDLAGAGAALLVLAAATLLAATAGAVRAGALVALGASAGFALAAGGVPGLTGSAAPGVGLAGAECLVVELLVAALPLGAAAFVFRRAPRPGALLQAAAAGALAGQAALHLTCSVHRDALHLWAFHVGALFLAALAGWLVEARLQPAATSARS